MQLLLSQTKCIVFLDFMLGAYRHLSSKSPVVLMVVFSPLFPHLILFQFDYNNGHFFHKKESVESLYLFYHFITVLFNIIRVFFS